MNKLLISFLISGLVLFFSCKKQDANSILGLDVQPSNDLLGVTITDSTALYMHTQKVDYVRSYNDQYKFLGSTQDPIFGTTDAGIYTNFSIANNLTNVSFGVNPILDSAELIIRFVGQFAGDTNTALNFNVQLLNDRLSIDSLYHTNSNLVKSSNNVNFGGKIRVRSGVYCLVLPLDYNYAQYILQTESNLTNNTAFQNAYKGFYISATNPIGSSGSGSIRRFDLDDDLSGVKLYYHNGTSVSSKGQSVLFTFRGSDALRFNHIEHNYATGATQNLYSQLSGDTVKGNTNVYLNSFGGTKVRVYLPTIQNFADSINVSINRAELIVKMDDSNLETYYGVPANLALIACGSDGSELLVIDQLEASDFVKYGGNYDPTNKQYVFNIARQMQQIITKKLVNYGFYLVNATPNRSTVIRRDNRSDRVIIGGKNNTAFKPYFKVTYVKYPYDK